MEGSSRRYIVTGAPGAGKTSVVEGLSALGYPVVGEAATDLIAAQQDQGVAEPWTSGSFIVDVVGLQMRRQSESPAAPVVVFDRSPFCTVALARYSGRPVPDELASEVRRLVAESYYEPEVFFVRPLGFVTRTDARRISYENSLAFEQIHETVYRELGFTLVEVPRADVESRIATVDRAIGSLARG